MNLSEDSMLSCVQLLVLSRFISFVSLAVHFASAVAVAIFLGWNMNMTFVIALSILFVGLCIGGFVTVSQKVSSLLESWHIILTFWHS